MPWRVLASRALLISAWYWVTARSRTGLSAISRCMFGTNPRRFSVTPRMSFASVGRVPTSGAVKRLILDLLDVPANLGPSSRQIIAIVMLQSAAWPRGSSVALAYPGRDPLFLSKTAIWNNLAASEFEVAYATITAKHRVISICALLRGVISWDHETTSD